MWTLILERIWYFYKVHPGRKESILRTWEERLDSTSWHARRIRE
jgi:biopolymer transport protein ExbB